MNKANIFLTAALIIAAIGCGGCRGSGGTMTMTTAAERVNIILKGSGTATVDWGDGSQPETVELVDNNQTTFTREFSDATSRTITITGRQITSLYCQNIKLTSLDVSRNRALAELNCSENQLAELDISRNTALVRLVCENNQLNALDVSRNYALQTLICCNNLLTSLNVRRNAILDLLHCKDNFLTSLDVSQNAMLRMLSVAGNQFTADELNALFATLGNNSPLVIDISGNPGSATCDPSIAQAMGWEVSNYTGAASPYRPQSGKVYSFEGYVGNSAVDLSIHVPANDAYLFGNYYYTRYQTKIRLDGVNERDVTKSDEYIDGRHNGTFTGTIFSDAQELIKFEGTWTNAEDTRQTDFKLSLVSTETFEISDVQQFREQVANSVYIQTAEELMRLYYTEEVSEEGNQTVTVEDVDLGDGYHQVTLIHEGLLDDSMYAQKIVIFARKTEQSWEVFEIWKNWKCRAGRGHQYWGTELCR